MMNAEDLTLPSGNDADPVAAELRVLSEVAKTLTSHLQLSELLQAVMDRIDRRLEQADFGMLLLWDPTEGSFRLRAACGTAFKDVQALESMSLQQSESITGKVYDLGKPLLLSSPSDVGTWMADMRPENRAAVIRAFGGDIRPSRVAAVPLRAGEHKFGVLILGSLQEFPALSERDLDFLTVLVDLISLAIDRARLNEEASAALEAKLTGRLRAEALATLSHELRTPLAAIKGYSTALLLEDVEWSDEKRSEFLRLIDRECDDLETMITDILDSSVIDVGQMALEHQPVRLERLVREVVQEVQNRTEFHRLVVDFPREFPILDADPRRIKQVVRNILDNAIKYSPDGGLVVIRGEARIHDAVVGISDQGVGITPEDLIPLFDKYFRVKSPTGYHVSGTGLGLPVARAIVEAHGGRIWAQSRKGEGTTISFSLPLMGISQNEDEHSSSSESGSQVGEVE
ncbi:MAG: ATP-binding protein [Bacteroidota bacterium]